MQALKCHLEQRVDQQVASVESDQQAPHVVDVDVEFVERQSIADSSHEKVGLEDDHELWSVHREVVVLVDPILDQVDVVEDHDRYDDCRQHHADDRYRGVRSRVLSTRPFSFLDRVVARNLVEEKLVKPPYVDCWEQEDPGVASHHQFEETSLPRKTEDVEVHFEESVKVEQPVAEDDHWITAEYIATR